MGDLANMTDNDGRLNGFRLLRWLRSHAEMEAQKVGECVARGDKIRAAQHRGMWSVLLYMQEDLERELTPPDYPEDDGAELPSDDKDTGPCEYCGRMAARVPVRDNGRVFLGCPGCAARARGDGVDLDDTCLTVDPDERNQS